MAKRGRPRGGLGADLALAACKKFPNTPNRTLAKKLFSENPGAFASINAARIRVQEIRGVAAKCRRSLKAVEWTPGKAGWKPECPPSAAEPWLPVKIDGPARVLVLSDIHVPYHSKEAVEAAVAYGRKLRPDVVLLDGDIADYYRLSRYQQDPKKRTFKEEMNSCRELLKWIRHKFKNARIIYKLGNHDERYDIFIWNRCVEFFDEENIQLHNVLKFAESGIERVGDSPILCGRLPVIHGHELTKGIASPVNQARGAFLKTLHTVLMGHGHRTSTHCEPDMWGREITTWSMGCLCDLRPEYSRFAKWNWGGAFIDVASDNEFDVTNFRISADYKVRTA